MELYQNFLAKFEELLYKSHNSEYSSGSNLEDDGKHVILLSKDNVKLKKGTTNLLTSAIWKKNIALAPHDFAGNFYLIWFANFQ